MKKSAIFSFLFALLFLVAISRAVSGSGSDGTLETTDEPDVTEETSVEDTTTTGTEEPDTDTENNETTESAEDNETTESAEGTGTTEESPDSPEWIDEDVVRENVDTDDDGEITPAELVAACQNYATLAAVFSGECPQTEAEAAALIATYDTNGDGQLNAAELSTATDDNAFYTPGSNAVRSAAVLAISFVIAACVWM